ncbi:hypothetical protein NUW54_g8946 [Trametes sanguinea]|uniref:Uncharacterized protein n=1 Tax=Trametes sanguinea TaxID=158606 RepID=A0ACC1PAX1_9APHY|nr:hypothetical protein NUW54_g8946 [Trametes sanguinea]
MFFLSRALAAFWAVGTCHDVLLEEALLALPDPPVAEAVQQDLRGTHSANARARRAGVWVDAAHDGMEVREDVQFDERCKLPRLALDVRDDLRKGRFLRTERGGWGRDAVGDDCCRFCEGKSATRPLRRGGSGGIELEKADEFSPCWQ